MPTNWDQIHILPFDRNPIYQYFEKSLLPPNPPKDRLVRIKCKLCNKYNITKHASQHSSTSNYWTHLKKHHNRQWQQLQQEVASNQSSILDPSISESSEAAITSESINKATSIFRRYPIIESTELRRLLVQFIIGNNLAFRVGTSPTLRALLERINPSIPRITAPMISAEIDLYYIERLNIFKKQLAIYK
jgi:hypothetical protein